MPETANRLIRERSPYLLQHAHNPVDWRPWGDEAFAAARAEDKPVFLSIGYSTCHWCHVMERESFENAEVAALLNSGFVCIKVDREERPDLDAIYMAATQLITGRGGWPNSLWLTPDGRPWYAGTYFPPDDRPGMAGFKTILKRLAGIWNQRRAEIEAQANELTAAMRQFSAGGKEAAPFSRDLVAAGLTAMQETFDPHRGGFGGAPKFPPHNALRLLLYEFAQSPSPDAREMLTVTLDAMAAGGIRDHLGGGFHRYTVDDRWFLPHFEKMLYDNALLAWAYAEAAGLLARPDYLQVARETCDWVLREMTSPGGGFYCALDADSDGVEGKYYVWMREEILRLLGEQEGHLFCRTYGVEERGNFHEEATGHTSETNILHLPAPIESLAEAEGMDGNLRERLDASRLKLLAARNARVRPHCDDKVLADWNGLMIGALARVGRAANAPRYLAAAERAGRFILSDMRPDGKLRHSWRDGPADVPAFLDDYAFLALGFLELHEATGDPEWRTLATELAETVAAQFSDPDGGGLFTTSAVHGPLLLRTKAPVDQATPAGNGLAAEVMIRIGAGCPPLMEQARRNLNSFSGLMAVAPQATQSLLLATAMLFDADAGPAGKSV